MVSAIGCGYEWAQILAVVENTTVASQYKIVRQRREHLNATGKGSLETVPAFMRGCLAATVRVDVLSTTCQTSFIDVTHTVAMSL